MHSVNILDIQQEILRLLSDTQEIVVDLLDSNVVSNNKTDQKQTLDSVFLNEQKSLLENEGQKAAHMEMVVAVVGTMKSGKSTTINAIVGQEILPNRALPMTALPTVVTHKSGQSAPTLTFDHPQPIIDLSKQIANKLKDIDTSTGYAFLGSGDGKKLTIRLDNDGYFDIKEKYEGQQEIFCFLHQLNDLMRAAKEIDIVPPYNEYQRIDSLPRIEVEFYHLKNNVDSNLGRLSILDTPGPNEFGQSDALKNVFRKQLAQASAILLVLDYTQLNSQADGVVRAEVASIQQTLGERLFVLVNKFDNFSKNTMNAEDTKTYVAENLMENVIKDRIFPVSSWFAYLGNRALSELENNGSIDSDSDWVEDFGTEALGRCWQNKINDNKEVHEAATALWEDSHFSTPLDKVITEAHAKVAFDSLDSTLNKLRSTLNGIGNGVNGRLTGLNTDIEVLDKMIEELRSDQKQLDKVEKLIEGKTNKVINANQEEIKTIISGYLLKADKLTQHFLATGKIESEEKKKQAAEKESSESGSLFFGFLRNNADKNNVEEALTSNNNEISYNDKKEAKKLIAAIKKKIKKITDTVLDASENALKNKTNTLQVELKTITDHALSTVLEKAQDRLKDRGVSVNFQLPQFNANSTIQFTMNDMLSGSIDTHRFEKKRSRVTNIFTHFFKDSWGKETYYTDETEYKINIKEIKKKVSDSMSQLKKSIENSQLSFLEEQLKDRVHEQINQIKQYLERYRGDLMQGIKDQRLDQEKKTSYMAELNSYINPLKNLLEDSEDQSKLLDKVEEA